MKHSIISLFPKIKNKPSWFIFFLAFCCFITNQIIFYYFVNGKGFPYGIKWMFLSSLLLVGIPYLFKRTKIIIYWFFIYAFIIHINLLYFRSYNTLIPFDSLQIKFSDLLTLLTSGIYSLRIQDILLYVPTIVLLIIHLKTKHSTSKISILPPLSAFGLFLLISILWLYPKRETIQKNLLWSFRWNQIYGYQWFGYPGYIYYSIINYQKDYVLTPEQIKEINTYIQDKKLSSIVPSDSIHKNILLIIVESLESFPINKNINNNEITPFLNSLLRDSLTFYTTQVTTQIKDGMSSDGQLILNTGLLPVQQGAACYIPHRGYKSLSSILKGQNHFSSCITILGHSPSMWNQSAMCQAYHYDRLYSENNFDNSDAFNMGMSDVSLVEQSFPIIQNLPQPFLVQFITVSSHNPFKLPEDKKRIHIPDSYHSDLARYLESINYTDYALSLLFQKLKESGLLYNTTLIITGDHYAFPPFFRKGIQENDSAAKIIDQQGFLPLIVYNGNKKGYYPFITGQIDIFPTIIDMLNIQTDWHGLGNSMFGNTPSRSAVSPGLEIIGDTTINVSTMKKAWEISNQIIRGNYFTQINNKYK